MAQKKWRGRGEGLIRQRPDGRWEARLDLGWQGGKRVRKTLYGRTWEDVRNKLDDLGTVSSKDCCTQARLQP
jgi:hypothetical protein